MATVIFDFDNTLFETQSHKERMFRLFESSGIPRDQVLSAYEDLVSPRERMYDMHEHRELLGKRGFDFPREHVDSFLGESFAAHLMPGAADLLSALRSRGHRLVLLTKGIDSFQRIKIRQAGIEEFFDEIHTCTGKKEHVLAKLDLPEHAYFINDSWKETESIARHFPALHCILFASEYGKKSCDISRITIPIAHDCGEVLSLVS